MGTTNTLLEKWCKFHNVVGKRRVFVQQRNGTMAAKGRLLDRQSLSLVQPKRRVTLGGMPRARE